LIDVRRLKELVKLMVANELTEIDLRDGEEQVTLRRPSPTAPVHAVHTPMAMPAAAPVPAVPVAPVPAPAAGGTAWPADRRPPARAHPPAVPRRA